MRGEKGSVFRSLKGLRRSDAKKRTRKVQREKKKEKKEQKGGVECKLWTKEKIEKKKKKKKRVEKSGEEKCGKSIFYLFSFFKLKSKLDISEDCERKYHEFTFFPFSFLISVEEDVL